MHDDRAGERGFTLIELLIATAITLVASFIALDGVRAAMSWASRAGSTAAQSASLDAVAAQLSADAGSAMSVAVPGADCQNGSPGTSATQVSFLTKDASGAAHVIGYASAGGTVARTLDGTASSYGGIDAMTATCETAAQAASVHPALAAYAVKNRLMSVGSQLGGNNVVVVHLRSGAFARDLHLVAAVPPSGFSVVGGATWHVVLYRNDQTHRSWLGLVQQSHIWVKSRLYVKVQGQSQEQMVCEWDPWGQQAPHDPHNDYNPNSFSEEQLPRIWFHATVEDAQCRSALTTALASGGVLGAPPGTNMDQCEDTNGKPVTCATPSALPSGVAVTRNCLFTYGATGCSKQCHYEYLDDGSSGKAHKVRVCDGSTTDQPTPDPSSSAAAPTAPPTPSAGELACAQAAESLSPPAAIAGEDPSLPTDPSQYPAYKAPGTTSWAAVASPGADTGGVNATLLGYSAQYLLVAESVVGGSTQVECVPLV